MKYGLSDLSIEKINNVFALYVEIEKAVLYGSRAKGNYRNGSDIDLTLYGTKLNFEVLLSVTEELDELLLPWMIDISIFSQITNPALCEHIERVGIVFYSRCI